MQYNKRGISLIALIITIAVLVIIAVTVVQKGAQRTEEASIAKHNENISMIQEEVESYYNSKEGNLPVVNETPYAVSAVPTLLAEITKRGEATENFYILDLSKLSKVAGKDGTGIGEDIYIVSSEKHNVYYIKGTIIKGIVYHGLISKNNDIALQNASATPTPTPVSDITGSGTQADPYVIWNVNGLNKIRDNLTACYELGCDIDASATSTWNSGQGWEPIGVMYSTSFAGSLDGKGHTIKNLYVNRPSLADGAGIFGSCEGTDTNPVVFKNLILDGFDINSDDNKGSLAGYIYYATVDNVIVKNLNIRNSVYGIRTAGGIVGGGRAAFTKCAVLDSNIRSQNSGAIIGQFNAWSPYDIINQCYAQNVTITEGNDANRNTGGLVGDASGTGVNISNSYAMVNILDVIYSGGLIGYLHGTITNSYFVGSLTGTSNVGGIAEQVYSTPTVTSTYWNTEVSGVATTANNLGTGLTTAQMKNQASYSGWDFTNIWGIDPAKNNGYPYLRTFNP